MTRKLYLLLVVVMSSGLIALGCGDDDDDGGGGSGGSDEPAKGQSSEPCIDQVNAVLDEQGFPNVSAKANEDLANICRDAAEGEAVRAKICETIIEDTSSGTELGVKEDVDTCAGRSGP